MNYRIYLPLTLLMQSYQWYSERQTASLIPCTNPVASQVNAVEFFQGWLVGIRDEQVDEFIKHIPEIIRQQMPDDIDYDCLIKQANYLASLYFPRASQDVAQLAYTRRHLNKVTSSVHNPEVSSNYRQLFGIPVPFLLDAEIPMDYRQKVLSRAFLRITSAGGDK